MADAVPISGHIDPRAFPFLLMDLHRHGATGSFKVEGPTYQKALYFRSGRVLFGSSNDPRDQLGAILIENGKITPEQLEDVNSKVGPGNPLAKVLTETGFVNQRELSEAARAKVERILSDIIAYTSGSFEFEDGVLPKGAIDLKLSTEQLALASVRRISDRNFVLRHLAGLDIVLAPTPGMEAALQELQAEAGGIIEQLDGRSTLKEAVSRTRLDEFEAAKVACALLFLGVVERKEVRVTAAEAPVFFLEDDEPAPELDLGETARAAFLVEEEPGVPAAFPEAPVFSASGSPTPPEPALEPEAFAPVSSSYEPAAPVQAAPQEAAAPAPPVPAVARFVAEPPRPSAPSPSGDVLAALDMILNKRTHEGPLEPLERPQERPAERPPASRAQRAPFQPAARSGSRRLLVSAVAAVAVITAAGVGLRFYLRHRPTPGAGVHTVAGPAPTPVAVIPTTTAPVAASAASPAPTAAAKGPTSSPVPVKTPETDVSQARTLLRNGTLPEAAKRFLANVKRAPAGTVTVQLFVACSPETVQKAVAAVDSKELYIVPVSYKGRDCFRMCWGLYPAEAPAAAAMRSLPEYFRTAGVTPRVVPASSILP